MLCPEAHIWYKVPDNQGEGLKLESCNAAVRSVLQHRWANVVKNSTPKDREEFLIWLWLCFLVKYSDSLFSMIPVHRSGRFSVVPYPLYHIQKWLLRYCSPYPLEGCGPRCASPSLSLRDVVDFIFVCFLSFAGTRNTAVPDTYRPF